MAEHSCELNWFQKTNNVLSVLRSKSEDVTHQLDNAAKCMDTVQSTVNDFIASFNDVATISNGSTSPGGTEARKPKKKLKKKSTGGYPKEDDVVFIKVLSGGLSNDNTFWCSYWFSDWAFNNNHLNEISDELGWTAKDLSAQKVRNIPSKQLLFCYSSVHELYLRAVILRCVSPELEVRFIDLGRIEFVSPNMTFYKLPEENPKKHPFLTLRCTLYYESEIDVYPRGARWCFRDHTEEKMMMARIVDCSQCNGFPLFKIEMKALEGYPPANVNEEVMKKISEHKEEEERIREQKIRDEKIEMERKEKEKKEKEKKEKEKKEKEMLKPVSHEVGIPGHENTSTLFPSKKKNISQYPTENKSQYPIENKSQYPTDNISHYHTEDKSHNPTENKHTKVEKSPSSHQRIEDKSLVKGKNGSQPALNKNESSSSSSMNASETGRPRRSSESTLPERVKCLKIMNRSSSMSNIENVDPTSIDLVEPVHGGEVKNVSGVKIENKHTTLEKARNKQKDKQKFELESNVYWVDLIPEEKRRVVPQRLAPLRNVFYKKDWLRQAHWYEIELMNVNELLDSESRMLFYAVQIQRKEIELSFSTNCIKFVSKLQKEKDDRRRFLMHAWDNVGTSSQYIFFVHPYNNIIGIAKIESIQIDSNTIFVQYYCLSNIGEHKIKYSGTRRVDLIDNIQAKGIVLKYKLSLECNQSVPTFESYYPWCGIPPLMEFTKPTYPPSTPKQILQQTSQKMRRSKEDINDNKQQRSYDNRQQRSYENQQQNQQQKGYDNQQQKGYSYSNNRDPSGKRGRKKSLTQTWRQHTEPTNTGLIIHPTEELWDQDDDDTKPDVESNPLPNQVPSLSTPEVELPSANVEELNARSPTACTSAVPTPVSEETVDTQECDFSCSNINTAICTIVTSVDSFFSTAPSVESACPMAASLESPITTIESVCSTAMSSMEAAAFPADNTVESEIVTVPLEDGSRPPSCYGYVANERIERLEEDWSVINGDSHQVNVEVAPSEANSVTVDTNSANSDWEEDVKDVASGSECSRKEPSKILPRSPDKNVGFYDGSGMWYPDMDSAVLAFKSTIKVFNEEYMRKCVEEKEMGNKDPERHYDENDNLSSHTESSVECS